MVVKSSQSYFSIKGMTEDTQNLPPEQTIIEWVLCSIHFKDIVLTAPEMINYTSIDNNYQEIPIKQIKNEYFNHAHYLL